MSANSLSSFFGNHQFCALYSMIKPIPSSSRGQGADVYEVFVNGFQSDHFISSSL